MGKDVILGGMVPPRWGGGHRGARRSLGCSNRHIGNVRSREGEVGGGGLSENHHSSSSSPVGGGEQDPGCCEALESHGDGGRRGGLEQRRQGCGV